MTVSIMSVTDHIADLICKDMGFNHSVDWFGLVMFYDSTYDIKILNDSADYYRLKAYKRW